MGILSSNKITVRYLRSIHACSDSIEWFRKQDKKLSLYALGMKAIEEGHIDWCNTFLMHCDHKNKFPKLHALYMEVLDAGRRSSPSTESTYTMYKRILLRTLEDALLKGIIKG